MPQDGMRWRHVVLNTHKSWLPGDPRGFRSYQHKVHSSGDYKTPPPPGEHTGLFRYSQGISGKPILIPEECREVVGVAILQKLRKLGYTCLAISVSAMHTHLQVELPDELTAIRQIMGQCKTASSHAIRALVPGRVWGRDGSFTPIDDPEHQRKAFDYILDQENAWKWSYKDPFPGEDSHAAG